MPYTSSCVFRRPIHYSCDSHVTRNGKSPYYVGVGDVVFDVWLFRFP